MNNAKKVIEKLEHSNKTMHNGYVYKLVRPDVVDDAIALLKELIEKQIDIVRCKDCRFRDPEDKMCECEHGIRWQTIMEDDWFCCGGEKK